MSPGPHATSFSVFATRVVGEYEVAGTLTISTALVVFRPDPTRTDPVVTFPLADISELRRDRALHEVHCLVGPRKLRLRLLPALVERTWEQLLRKCTNAKQREVGTATTAFECGGHVDYELNVVLTVSGELVLSWDGLSFKPGGDARILGRKPFHIPLADLQPVERADGNRRILYRTADKLMVFRGPGAQRTWLALQVVRDIAAQGTNAIPILADVSITNGIVVYEGVFGVGAHGFGFGGLPRIAGPIPSFWSDILTFQGAEPRGGATELVLSDRRLDLLGQGAATVIVALAERWLEVAPSARRPDGSWAAQSVLHRDGALLTGVLEVTFDGLVHRSVVGVRTVVATRGSAARVQVDEHDPHLLKIVSDEVETRVHVRYAAAEARTLGQIFGSMAWGHPEEGYEPVTLGEQEMAMLQGSCAYVRLVLADETVGRQSDTLLTPEPQQVRATLQCPTPPPAVPFACMLEVVNKTGRFLVPGTVLQAQAVVAKGSAGRGVPRYQIVFRFGGHVRAANRRSYFRLTVNEMLAHLDLVAPDGTSARVREAKLANVSRRGCALLVPSPWPLGTVATLDVPMADESRRVLNAQVVQCVQVDKLTWRLGAAYVQVVPDAEGHVLGSHEGAELYNDRELAFLRNRKREG